jgi:EpsD family peptidyl-prolyl cis-trans isomerase
MDDLLRRDAWPANHNCRGDVLGFNHKHDGAATCAKGELTIMTLRSLMLCCAVLGLAACHKGDTSAPKGQVVATINGTEVTMTELKEETESAGPGQQNGANALQTLVTRKLLADAAKSEKLDQLPTTAIQLKRAEESVLVEALMRKLRDSAPAPSADEARVYVSEHPSSFSRRRIFVVDQYIVPNAPQSLFKEMEPINALPEALALLKKHNLQANRVVGTIDALTIDGEAAEKLAALPPNAIFISPEGDGMRLNYIRDVEIEPIPANQAEKIALETLRNRRISQLVSNKASEIVGAAMPKVKFNPAFAPKAPAQAPAGK